MSSYYHFCGLDSLQDYSSKLKVFEISTAKEGSLLSKGVSTTVKEYDVGGVTMVGRTINDASEEAQIMYMKECLLVAKLRHPNIVQVHGFLFLPEDGLALLPPIMLMEKMNVSLTHILHLIPKISLGIKMSIYNHIARGLIYLHARTPPIIHGNLTPTNILLDGALTAKIANFSCARLGTKVYREAQVRPLGHPSFMPPESDEEVGPSLDVFSFGHLMLCTSVWVST